MISPGPRTFPGPGKGLPSSAYDGIVGSGCELPLGPVEGLIDRVPDLHLDVPDGVR